MSPKTLTRNRPAYSNGRPKPKIVAFANQKGGVGKTTMALGLAGALGAAGKNVLVIDMDPQCNASGTILPDFETRQDDDDFLTVNDIFEAGGDPNDTHEAIHPTSTVGVWIMPAHQALANRDAEASTGIEVRLKKMLAGLAVSPIQYDYVILDCPPSVGRLTVNAFVAAEEVVLVVEPHKYGKQALKQVATTLQEIRDSYGSDIRVAGVVLNKVGLSRSAQKSVEEITAEYAGVPIKQMPLRTAIFGETADQNVSVFEIKHRSAKGIRDWFVELATELGYL